MFRQIFKPIPSFGDDGELFIYVFEIKLLLRFTPLFALKIVCDAQEESNDL